MELFRKISDNPSIVWINGEVVAERIDADYYHANHIQLNKSKIPMFKISTYCSLSKKRFNPNKYNKEYFKYIDISNVNNNTGVFEYQLVNINEAPSRARKKVSKNDIIISTVRPNRNAVAIINIEDDELVVSTGFAVIECKKNIDSYYLFAVLKTSNSIGQLVRKTSGGLYPAVSEQDVMEIEIPIPSPEIQKYIGDKVRKAEELREEAKRLKKEAEGIIYKELNFGSLEDKLKIINNKYTWVGLHNLGIRIDSKYYNEKVLRIKDYFNKHYETIKLKECLQYCSRGKSFAESSEDGIILIKTKNLNNSFINYERNFVYEKEVNNNLILKEKDLIFASMGVGSLGKIDMYYPSEEKATIDGTLMLLRFKSDSKLKPEYVMEFLRTHIGQKLIYQNVVGSTGIISISVDDLINIDIPYIDDEKQEKISNFTNKYLTDIYASKRLIQEAKQDVEDLIEGNFDMSKVKANS